MRAISCSVTSATGTSTAGSSPAGALNGALMIGTYGLHTAREYSLRWTGWSGSGEGASRPSPLQGAASDDVSIQPYDLPRACRLRGRGEALDTAGDQSRARAPGVRARNRAPHDRPPLLRAARSDTVQQHPALLRDRRPSPRVLRDRAQRARRERVRGTRPGVHLRPDRCAALVRGDDPQGQALPAPPASAQRVLPVSPASGRALRGTRARGLTPPGRVEPRGGPPLRPGAQPVSLRAMI